jgi:DNA-binding transcriptional regulator YbjK
VRLIADRSTVNLRYGGLPAIIQSASTELQAMGRMNRTAAKRPAIRPDHLTFGSIVHLDKAGDPSASAIAEVSRLLPQRGTFLGTRASTARGQAKVLKFLKIAKDIVLTKSFSRLTFREVARQGGVGIYHVQYYFQSLEDLVESLLVYIIAIYVGSGGKQLPRKLGPKQELEAKLRTITADSMEPATANYFFQFWALSRENARYARIMDLTTDWYLRNLSDLVAKANPILAAPEAFMRASLIAAQVEGFQYLFCRPRNDRLDSGYFFEKAIATLLHIAMQPRESVGRPLKERH